MSLRAEECGGYTAPKGRGAQFSASRKASQILIFLQEMQPYGITVLRSETIADSTQTVVTQPS